MYHLGGFLKGSLHSVHLEVCIKCSLPLGPSVIHNSLLTFKYTGQMAENKQELNFLEFTRKCKTKKCVLRLKALCFLQFFCKLSH